MLLNSINSVEHNFFFEHAIYLPILQFIYDDNNICIFFSVLLVNRDALATTLSALYGKLLVVMGTAFPMAEVISTYIPPSFYEVYYLYLYIGSMFFLLYMYMVLVRDKRRRKKDEEQQLS